ncbi:hypothetical protein [Zeaxanthinibacter enoshimensis]|uniref:Uncharacterized protein n=1 Tax=Zeaxanthinibacter enoshimensis TaxID=392009 RepID=A0A4R6TML9_9FLAO|nr:hypothetical protein [Zeaxanthinibacter enoshimensis]TDQ32762.1 hypothetical protein CLV82_0595 [Zeaxanthinibacter enoshimensis]
MISSVFGKTKPINYIILMGFLFFFYWITHFFIFNASYEPEQILGQTLVLSLLLFSVFVVDFIVKRNQIMGGNSYAMLYYTMLFVIFPQVLMDNNAIFCGFFLLLATRRAISLKTAKDVKLKIYDASLWIALSSLFYQWALLYMVVLYVAIYFYDPKNIRNWLLPLAGTVTVALISWSFLILLGREAFFGEHFRFVWNFDLQFYASWQNSTKLIAYIVLVVFTGFLAFLKLGQLGMGRIITLRLIVISVAVGLVITLLETGPGRYPVLITFFPAATLLAKYVEIIRRHKIKEVTLVLSVLIPFAVLLLETVLK